MADQRILRICCPNLACGSVLAAPASARGQLMRCGRCGLPVRIPQRQSQPAGDVAAKRDAAKAG